MATGCYDNDSLQIYLKCLEEGAARRRMEDEKWGWSWKRRKGDSQSWGKRYVARAQGPPLAGGPVRKG